jgi:multiple sugar transport system permease protein
LVSAFRAQRLGDDFLDARGGRRLAGGRLAATPSSGRRRLCDTHHRLRRRVLPHANGHGGANVSQFWPLLTGYKGLNFPRNFVALWNNQLFWPAVVFTIEYTILVTILLLSLGLGMALLVQEAGRWVGALRTIFLLPVAVGLASASLLFWGFYSPSIGPISPILEAIGVIHQPISFLQTPTSALLSTTFLIVWKFAGLYMLILLVGLQGIPSDVFEASALDGAGRGQTFRYITLPLLRPSLAMALILCVTGSLLAFDQFYILTKGGPDNTTVTVVQLIYREAFQRQNLGTAAAISVVVLLALLVLNAVQFLQLRDPERS